MKQTPKTRGFGCTAILAIFCLTFFTLAEAALLWHLNPDWFDRLAWWRGPILQPDLIVAQDPESRAREKREFEANQEKTPPADPGQIRLMEAASVRGDYTPARGLTLSNRSNAEIKIAAGAVRDAATIKMTPVMTLPGAMRVPFAGPVYDIRVGNAEHYDFQGNVTITLPFHRPSAGDKPVIVVWEKDGWKELASTVDHDKKTVTATTPHASIFTAVPAAIWRGLGVIPGGQPAAVAVGGFFLLTSPTVQGNIRTPWWRLNAPAPKETPNFVIHYMTEGAEAVVKDADYVLKGGRRSGDHPLFIEDLATWLEQAMARLDVQGIALPPTKLLRHDVFLTDLGKDDLGQTPPGGPVWLSCKLGTAHQNAPTVEPIGLMKSTVAHELVHVAQGRFYSALMDFGGLKREEGNTLPGAVYRSQWWLELSAEYLGDRVWKPDFDYDVVRKATLVDPNFRKLCENRLPALPMDAPYSARTYCHALFFVWLDSQYGSDGGMRVIKDMYQRGDTTLDALDQSTQRVLQKPLADLFAEYAADFYYRDLWRGTLTPTVHRGVMPELQALAQMARFLDQTADGGYTEHTFAVLTGYRQRHDEAFMTIPNLPNLTAVALYVHAGIVLPEVRKGKLVVKFETRGGTLPRASYAVDKITDALLPLQGSHNELKPLPMDSPLVIEKFGTVGGNNRATFLFVNPSMSQDTTGFAVRRWLLLAPSYILAARANGQWHVAWHKAELKDYPETFKGYNLYRRRPGEDANWILVKEETTAEEWTGNDDGNEYIYGVRVKDALGNLSEIREQDNNDPWVGTWEGDIKLREGSIAVPLRRGIKKLCDDHDGKEQDRINRIQDGGQRQREQQNQVREKQARDEILGEVMRLVDLVEQATRIGIPMQVKIRRDGAKYYLAITEIVWQPTGWRNADDLELERLDMNTLKIKAMPPDLEPLVLNLRRTPPNGRNHIRGEWKLETPENPDERRFRFGWDFTRKR